MSHDDPNPIRVALIGNLEPPHSTENELRKAILACGHGGECFQEGQRDSWLRLGQRITRGPRPDLIIWVRTASELARIPVDLQTRTIDAAKQAGIPVVGYHLDIWWGLARQRELTEVPYFRLVDMMCTADGGHQSEWASIGVDHRWFPPAVSEFECVPGTPRDEYRSRVAFVGGWQGGYHPEAEHRHKLIAHLQARGDVEFWPRKGEHAVRGPDLRDLYASVDVIVGDSCNADGRGWYCSDRIPETLGRGGYLLHPRTTSVTDGLRWSPVWSGDERDEVPMFRDGEHLACWEAGVWDMLDDLIAASLDDPHGRRHIAETGRLHVLEHHTYTQRMRALVAMLRAEGRLP